MDRKGQQVLVVLELQERLDQEQLEQLEQEFKEQLERGQLEQQGFKAYKEISEPREFRESKEQLVCVVQRDLEPRELLAQPEFKEISGISEAQGQQDQVQLARQVLRDLARREQRE